ncbi:hypothetical protein D9M72_264930 [compost metagenome]
MLRMRTAPPSRYGRPLLPDGSICRLLHSPRASSVTPGATRTPMASGKVPSASGTLTSPGPPTLVALRTTLPNMIWPPRAVRSARTATVVACSAMRPPGATLSAPSTTTSLPATATSAPRPKPLS